MNICIFNVFNFNGNSVDISEYSVGNNVEQYMILFIWIWFDKSNLFYLNLEKFRGIKVNISEKFRFIIIFFFFVLFILSRVYFFYLYFNFFFFFFC